MTFKEIQKTSLLINDEIERKLYCIKANNYCYNEKFKKEFNFSFSTVINLRNINKDNDINILMDGNTYLIDHKSRIIDFIIKGVIYKRFIYSCEYFQKVFKNLNIQCCSTKNDKLNKSDNSLESEISDDKLYDLFNDENILTIEKIETDDEKLNKLFQDSRRNSREKILNLSLNAEFYYKDNYNDIFNLNIFSKYIDEFKKFIWYDRANILYLVGPKGTSKSIFLMNFCYMCNISNVPVLYINYKILKNLEQKKRVYIFKKEMVYLFFNLDKFKDFYKSKYHKIIKDEKNNFIHNLKGFTQELIKIYENTFDKKILLVIDNFDENDSNIIYEMEQLIKLIIEKKGYLRLILAGHSDLMRKKFELFLLKKNFSDIIENQALFIYDLKIKNNNEIKTLAAFNYKKIQNEEELEKTILNDEIQYCEKFNLYGMHYSMINNGNNLDITQISKYIPILPLEYLHFTLNEDKSIKFEFFNQIFLKAIKKSINSEIKEKSLKFLLSEDNKDFLINGIFEEKLLNTLISYNKLNLKNMNTPENNLLEIKKICEFKYKNIEKTKKNIETHSPIIITQENFRGEFYDLLALIPKKENEEYIYTAYLIQIGTNKTKSQIDAILDDFKPNEKNYLDGIRKYLIYKVKIKYITLLFIFDKGTQDKLYLQNGKINEFGSKYCLQNNIKFYCFSLDSYELYKTFDIKNYYSIDEFGNFDKYIKRNWSAYTSEKFYFLSSEELKFIQSLTNKEITKYGYYSNKDITFPEIIIDNENIYVIMNDINKYFVIKGDIYSYIEDHYDIIDKKIIDRNEKFDLFVLIPIQNDIILKMQKK